MGCHMAEMKLANDRDVSGYRQRGCRMGLAWKTKYGMRRVRVDPPTLEEALFAAEGLTPDSREQLQIAADLICQPVHQVQADAERIIKSRANSSHVARDRRPLGAVVVERRGPARRKSRVG